MFTQKPTNIIPKTALLVALLLYADRAIAQAQEAAPGPAASQPAGTAPGQAPVPDPLGAIVAEALRANLGLAAERIAVRQASADVTAARGLFLPSLGMDARSSHLSGVPNIGDFVNPAFAALNGVLGSNRFPTNLDFTLPQADDSHLELRQPLFDPAIVANYAAARSRREGRGEAYAVAARRLAADVQTAYLNEASARRAVEIYAAALALVDENQRVAERLVAAGRATPEAVFRARADRSAIVQQLAEARQKQTAAARVLNQMLRRPLDAEVEVVPDSALERPLAVDVDAAVTGALARREELREFDAGVRAAQAGARAAGAAYLPSVSLAVDYGFQGRDLAFRPSQDYWVASVVVSWNLFDGGQDAARRGAAGLEVARVRTLKQDLEEKIALEVRTAYEAAATAHAAIATAEDRLDAARSTWQLVRRRYEEGVASPVELVDARTELTTAELNRSVTAYQYAIRYVDLERAAALRDIDPEGASR
ncbi:MAG TPA: TolC family protein [Gemmatimonadales bacterium]|nr:TolC family protein [Gemmatimonadales bacterium]